MPGRRRTWLARALAALLAVGIDAHFIDAAAGSGPALLRIGEVVLDGPPGQGGLSGLWLSAEGDRMVAVGDTGTLLTARPLHDPGGKLTGVADIEVRPLPGLGRRGKYEADAEDLARDAEGGWLVAFERHHRILRYEGDEEAPADAPEAVPLPPAATVLPGNEGIEALAASADGTLVACAEASVDGGHPCWIGRDGNWTETRYRSTAGFSPVALEFLPSGDLLVLERDFSIVGWFRNRLTLVPAAAIRSAGVLAGVELGAVAPGSGADNLEGMAVRPAPDGDVLIYLVVDDNFSLLQSPTLVQYRLSLPAPEA